MEHPCEDCVTTLLRVKSPDGHNTVNLTPVFAAIRNHHIDCLKGIIQEGADVNAKEDLIPVNPESYGYQPPMNTAIWNFITPLIWTAEDNKADCMEILIQAGSDVNLANNAGDRPLYKAACKAPACVDILLNAGATVNAVNKNNSTALLNASHCGCKESIQLLIGAGADVNLADKNKFAPVFLATQTGQIECIPILVEAGADINIKGPMGETPLVEAAAIGISNLIKLVIQLGADLNIADNAGNTALMHACQKGIPEHVNCLIEAGADVNFVNNYQQTALFSAVDLLTNNPDIKKQSLTLQLLLKSNINVNVYNVNGQNALEYYIFKVDCILREICMLLLAAGETLDHTTNVEIAGHDSRITGFTQLKVAIDLKQLLDISNPDLQNICRFAIRTHLINLNQKGNLFFRIPKLGLPVSLVSYLLYNQSLFETGQSSPRVNVLEEAIYS